MAKRRPGKRVETPEGLRVLGKNANGEGSVYRQADGRWVATWWAPGETKRPRKATGKTRDEATKRRERRQAAAGLILNDLRVVGPLADWWLNNVHKAAVRPSSWAKAKDRVRRIKATLGDRDVTTLDYRAVIEWQNGLLAAGLAPNTVRVHRGVLSQILDEAVKLGLIVGNVVRSLDPLQIPETDAVALERSEAHALIEQARLHRLGAVVTVLFLQGWRVSEALGLAWDDFELEHGTWDDIAELIEQERWDDLPRVVAHVRRASVYVDGQGQQLGEAKAAGAYGKHYLMPTVVWLLSERRTRQTQERAEAPVWQSHEFDGQAVDLVFTTPTGGLVLRQAVAKIVKQAAKSAGILSKLATQTGRRTVITIMYDDGEVPLDDIAEFVGHARTSTTARYVKRRKRRPRAVSDRATALLDPRPGAGAADTADTADTTE